jgi:hypothetical protein
MGLTKKILLFTALLTVGIVVATLAFTTVRANALAQANLNERLTGSRGIWDAFQADRLGKLKLAVRTLGNEPAFKALIEAGDAATIADTLQERSEDLGADFFMATNPAGLLVARSDKPTERGTDLSKDPVVEMSVKGEETGSFTRCRPRCRRARISRGFCSRATPSMAGSRSRFRD